MRGRDIINMNKNTPWQEHSVDNWKKALQQAKQADNLLEQARVLNGLGNALHRDGVSSCTIK